MLLGIGCTPLYLAEALCFGVPFLTTLGVKTIIDLRQQIFDLSMQLTTICEFSYLAIAQRDDHIRATQLQVESMAQAIETVRDAITRERAAAAAERQQGHAQTQALLADIRASMNRTHEMFQRQVNSQSSVIDALREQNELLRQANPVGESECGADDSRTLINAEDPIAALSSTTP